MQLYFYSQDAFRYVLTYNRYIGTLIHVYFASSTAINKDKPHCACVLTIFTDGGTLKHTTIMLLQSTCIFHFIYCNKQGQTPLRMRVDHFYSCWDTKNIPQSCCFSPHVYYAIKYCFLNQKKNIHSSLLGYSTWLTRRHFE